MLTQISKKATTGASLPRPYSNHFSQPYLPASYGHTYQTPQYYPTPGPQNTFDTPRVKSPERFSKRQRIHYEDAPPPSRTSCDQGPPNPQHSSRPDSSQSPSGFLYRRSLPPPPPPPPPAGFETSGIQGDEGGTAQFGSRQPPYRDYQHQGSITPDELIDPDLKTPPSGSDHRRQSSLPLSTSHQHEYQASHTESTPSLTERPNLRQSHDTLTSPTSSTSRHTRYHSSLDSNPLWEIKDPPPLEDSRPIVSYDSRLPLTPTRQLPPLEPPTSYTPTSERDPFLNRSTMHPGRLTPVRELPLPGVSGYPIAQEAMDLDRILQGKRKREAG